MIEAIDSGNEEPRDLEMGRVLLAVQQRLIGLSARFEMQPLRDLRESVDQLVNAIRHHDSEKSLQFIGQQMTAVADRIESLNDIPTPDDEAAITHLVGLLQDSRKRQQRRLDLGLFANRTWQFGLAKVSSNDPVRRVG